jgi:hypothetical protein
VNNLTSLFCAFISFATYFGISTWPILIKMAIDLTCSSCSVQWVCKPRTSDLIPLVKPIYLLISTAERDPNKRRVKPAKQAFLDMGPMEENSSDDSDFEIDQRKMDAGSDDSDPSISGSEDGSTDHEHEHDSMDDGAAAIGSGHATDDYQSEEILVSCFHVLLHQ